MSFKSITRAFYLLPLLILPAVCWAAQPENFPRNNWYGIYAGDVRIGYVHIVVERCKYNKKSVYRITESAEMPNSGYVLSTYIDNDFNPIYQMRKLKIGKTTTLTESSYGARYIEYKTVANGKVSRQQISIPSKRELANRYAYEIGGIIPKPGQIIPVSDTESIHMRIKRTHVKTIGREIISASGVDYHTWKISMQGEGRSFTYWLEDNGAMVKVEMMPDITLIREKRNNAIADPALQSAQYGIISTTGKISDPLHIDRLRIKITGLPNTALPTDDSRQCVTISKADHSAEFMLTRVIFDPTKSISLPAKAGSMDEYVRPSERIEASDKAIIELAKKIMSNEKSAYAAAAKLCAWVHSNIRQDMAAEADSMSAVSVLKKKRGVCRHLAVLYTALARAAGIPTRLVQGLVYSPDGFAHHAWAESFLGEWVPFDPTFGSDVKDAIHVKYCSGNPDELGAFITQLYANICIDILDFDPGLNDTNGGVSDNRR